MARKMKDSGIEWIGEIPEGWEVVKAKYLFAQRNEKGNSALVLLSPTQKYGVIPQSQLEGVVQVKENTDLRAFKTIHIGDFVISLRSFQGGFEFSNYEGVCSPAYQVFHATKDLCNDFFRYLFKSDGFISKINSLTVGIREGKNIQYWDFSNMLLALPPKEVQIRSAQYLSAKCTEIDTMLSKTRSSIEEYKKLKQAVITQAVTKGVRGEREMKDSGVEWIGEIPKTWIISNIGRFCFVTKLAGFEYTKEMDGHISPYGDVPIVRAQNIKMGRFIPNTREYISLALSQKLNRCALNEKCLIITFIGAGIGEVALFSDATRHHLAPNVAKIVISHDMKQFLDDRFLLYFLMSSAGQEEVNKIKKATAQPSLSMQTIRSIKLAFPSTLQEQKEIADFLDAKCAEIDRLIAKKEQLVKELESYKKSLIYEVVTGKREV